MIKTVVFVCAHNAGRSQMAEAFFNQLTKAKLSAFPPEHGRVMR